MADNNIEEILQPFKERAVEAEARLERLESAIANSGIAKLKTELDELRLELINLKADQAEQTEKTQQELQPLIAENAKLQYRVTHLVQAIKDADCKLLSK